MAAPNATHSSGLMSFWGSLPIKVLTKFCTAGIRVEPPTKRTLSMSDAERFASFKASFTGPSVFLTRSAVNSSNFARERSMFKCKGPSAVAVMKGRLMLVLMVEESSFFAFSAASFKRCKLMRSAFKSTPFSFLKLSAIQSMIFSSKSSPPNLLLPRVDCTSKTPSESSKMETSKVPPPKS